MGPGNERLVTAWTAFGMSRQQDFVDAFESTARVLGSDATVTLRQVQRWLSSRPGRPHPRTCKVLEAMFSTTVEELGFDPPRAAARKRPGSGRHELGERLTRALANPARFVDSDLLLLLAAAVDRAALLDGEGGPRAALPHVGAVLDALEQLIPQARGPVRTDLLVLGARAAELIAWLHRDSGSPGPLTALWHDRALEWSTMAGDGAMHAYVLLRKAQATSPGDPARMGDLARAAHSGPFRLPARPRAEALQQEARALALAGAPLHQVQELLHRAVDEVAGAPAPSAPATCTGPLGAEYTLERLMVQWALCLREAGRPELAVAMYEQYLPGAPFSVRDRAFFGATHAGALARAGEPDAAAAMALAVLPLVSGPLFGQALAELRRTAAVLSGHGRRAAVRRLRSELAGLSASTGPGARLP
ncbi:XRE family transcriptional regulator [Kitasatospora sp. NPDC088134]|uniref:XRE family transcriptional regulator n=1 Tax=Kitasatospora sp. NPDC088134 TaxID=3364071 RepID=UPI0038043A68